MYLYLMAHTYICIMYVCTYIYTFGQLYLDPAGLFLLVLRERNETQHSLPLFLLSLYSPMEGSRILHGIWRIGMRIKKWGKGPIDKDNFELVNGILISSTIE